MTIPAEILAEKLAAIREVTLAALLEAQAEAITEGLEVEPEPIRRDAQGRIRRDGPLKLPSRGDLGVTGNGRTAIRQIEGPPGPVFKPFTAFTAPDFAAEMQPFAWDRAVLDMRTSRAQPSWTALRHWFLEWFQARPNDLSPELCGAVHRLQGPWRAPGRWRAVVDLGSAPASCVAVLIAAVSQSGCTRLRIGGD